MRILIASNLYPPYVIGGAEKYVYEIANALSEKEDVYVLTTSSFSFKSIGLQKTGNVYRYYPLNLYHTYNAKNKPEFIKPFWHLIDLWNPHSYLVFKKILKVIGPDVVFTHNVGNFSMSIFEAIREYNVPHVHMLHDYSLLCPRATLCNSKEDICGKPNKFCAIYRKIKRYFIGNPDAVLSPSYFTLETHLKEGFFPNSKTFRLQLPVMKLERVEKDYNVLKILYVGQIVKHKGLHVLARAIKNIEGIKVDVVGGLTEFNSSNINCHGYVEERELPKFYKTANVVVVPSIWLENSPKVIYEAFSYSTPVVGSRIGGIPELVRDNKNGLLFTAGNSVELREKLLTLKEDTSILKRLERGSIKTAENLTMDKHIMRLRKIMKSIS